MKRTRVLVTGIGACLFSAASLAGSCLPSAVQPPGLSVVAPEMLRPLVAEAECLQVVDVVARLRAATAALAGPAAGTYVPLTKDDNTPWRFDMNQNGKRMTSVEFDAWMKAKGIRVATGKPGTSAVPAAAPQAGSPPPEN